MITTDCHVHSAFSSDSSTPVTQMIEKAISLGFDTFYLTDHMDFDFPVTEEGMDFLFSPSSYFKTLRELKETYRDRIQIKTGIELGLKTTASVKEQIDRLLADYSFDLIIGSTHLVDDLDPYNPDYWEGSSEEDRLRHFFEITYENIQAHPYVQVLGHLDYAIRYSPSKGKSFSYVQYKDIIDSILTFIIQHEIALEVNTSGYKHGLGAPNPSDDVIKRYLELGGSMISIGSDAHQPEFYAYEFDRTRKLLLSLGVTSYTTFEHGKPVFHSL